MPKKSSVKKEKSIKKTSLEKLSDEEFEKKVLELSESGMTSEKIGESLRKQGIHPKEYSKNISKILKEKEKYSPPELKNIQEKLEKIKVHYEKNRQDKKAMREIDRIFSKLRKIRGYYGISA